MKNAYLLTILLTSFSVFAGSPAFAAMSAETRDHLTISSVEIQDLTDQYPEPSFTELNIMQPADGQGDLGGLKDKLDAADVIVDKIINIGTKIWNVIEKGKPVVSYSRNTANALPQNALRWDQLQNWRRPTSKVYGVSYKNLMGIEVVRFVYRVVLLYGGDVGGTGKYIGYASVEPLEMNTAWLYTFNASVKVESVYNMGSSKNPVAGMLLNVNWTVSTVLKSSTVTETYTLDGNGSITSPNQQNIIRLQ